MSIWTLEHSWMFAHLNLAFEEKIQKNLLWSPIWWSVCRFHFDFRDKDENFLLGFCPNFIILQRWYCPCLLLSPFSSPIIRHRRVGGLMGGKGGQRLRLEWIVHFHLIIQKFIDEPFFIITWPSSSNVKYDHLNFLNPLLMCRTK